MKTIDAKLISSASNISYLTNFFGFSETEREAYVLLFKNKKYLITDGRYTEAAKKQVKEFEVLDMGTTNFILSDAGKLFKKEKIKNLGFEENNLTVLEYKKLKKLVKMTPVDLTSLRSVKNAKEIKEIKNACKIGDDAFSFILDKIRTRVSEKELASELEIFFKKRNAQNSFPPIVAFGPNSAVPHHQTGNTKLKRNQIILLDFGVKVNGYCSDMTRTIFFGSADKKFKHIHKTVLDAQQKAIKVVKENINASAVDKAARNHILENKYPNIIHSVGHGIGLEIHEAPNLSPKSKDVIRNGMVFSVEPGIYIPGYGGVRIEDLVLVRSGKAELISTAKRGLIELNDR